MTSVVTVPGTPEETATVGKEKLGPGWVTRKAVVSGLPERVKAEVLVLITVQELVTSEVTAPGTSSEMVEAGIADLASVPGRATQEAVISS